MNPIIVRSRRARADIIEIYLDLGRSDPTLAERFLNLLEETLERLARMPGLGERCQQTDPLLRDVRCNVVGSLRWIVLF